MILGVHVEVFLALTCAMFLTAVALVLEFLAHQSHKSAERYRNSGFIFVNLTTGSVSPVTNWCSSKQITSAVLRSTAHRQ